MPERDTNELSLDSVLLDQRNSFASTRSSLDSTFPDRKSYEVTIIDESGPQDESCESVARYILVTKSLTELPSALRCHLSKRNEQRTRWINFTGGSDILIDDLAQRYLDEHGCLDSQLVGKQSLGGPIKRKDSGHFIWMQNSIWYIGQKSQHSWSSVQQCGFRMVVCLPTTKRAGTLITNFTGKQETIDRVSAALTTDMLSQHSMGQEAMSCVWVLACSIMRAITAQLDLAFHNFDPLDRTHTLPHIDQLPSILQQANELARIDRYTSSLNEILEFFETVRTFQQTQTLPKQNPDSPEKCYSRISERSNLESELAKQKIRHAQQLCRTYIKQYESHVQMMLSYSTTQIADRLDGGRKLGERIAAVGVVLAAVSGLTSPLAVVTGYYGMNVRELTDGGNSSLFDFWTVAAPVFTISLVVLAVMFARVVSSTEKLAGKKFSLRLT